MRGNLPFAIESTWLLTEASLADELASSQVSVFTVKAAYSTAITRYQPGRSSVVWISILTSRRFVSGLLDSHQETRYKVSMFAKAQEIGLPALFVDLRHEAIHGEMPSLKTLRNAGQQAMQWLWDDYWGKLKQPHKSRLEDDGNVSPVVNVDSDLPTPLDKLSENAAGSDEVQEAEAMSNKSEGGRWERWEGYWSGAPLGAVSRYRYG